MSGPALAGRLGLDSTWAYFSVQQRLQRQAASPTTAAAPAPVRPLPELTGPPPPPSNAGGVRRAPGGSSAPPGSGGGDRAGGKLARAGDAAVPAPRGAGAIR